MRPSAFIVALLVRSLVLLLPQTFFSPDEFYQALEPAHQLVFGYGHLTWEWQDLPKNDTHDWWNQVVVGGRMRGYLWPSAFAAVYKCLKLFGLDASKMIVCPSLPALDVMTAASAQTSGSEW